MTAGQGPSAEEDPVIPLKAPEQLLNGSCVLSTAVSKIKNSPSSLDVGRIDPIPNDQTANLRRVFF